MLEIMSQETFPEVPGVSVWSDEDDTIAYVMAESPRFRLVDGKPQFKFIKYRDKVGSDRKGSFAIFDLELAVDDVSKAKVLEIWQKRLNDKHAASGRGGQPPKAKLGVITYTRGAVSLLLEEGSLITRIRGVAEPTGFGNNVSAWMLQLDAVQTPIFEAAMQGKGTSIVGAEYDMYFQARMPPAEVHAWFYAKRHYELERDTDIEVSWWTEDHYRDNFREYLETHKVGGVEPNVPPGPDPAATAKVKKELTDWGWRTLQDAILQEVQSALKPIGDESKKASDKVMEQLGGDDLDNLHISLRQTQITDIDMWFRDRSPVEWHFAPNGHLPALTTLTDKEGNLLRWEDYSMEVEPSAFFQELHVLAQVNAPFERLPIHSVEVHVTHNGKPVAPTLVNEIGTGQSSLDGTLINSPDDVLHFAAYADNVNKYTHWYEVNFKGESKTFTSTPVEVDAGSRDPLVINLDETGVLSLDIEKGDIDFEQVRSAEVVLSYEDKDQGVTNVGGRFYLDAAHPAARFQKVVFVPKTKPWTYHIKYTMAEDGREVQGPPQTEWGPTLFVNDLFSSSRFVRISAVGDLEQKIDRIVLDLEYLDEERGYGVAKQVTLKDGAPDEEWRFPVVADRAGTVKYSGQIFYKAGTQKEIEPTVAKTNQIVVGDVVEDRLEVEIVPDFLFDDPAVRLVTVELTHEGSTQTATAKFRRSAAGGADPSSYTWRVDLADDKDRTYTWQAKFYIGNSVKTTDAVVTTDGMIVPELSQVKV